MAVKPSAKALAAARRLARERAKAETLRAKARQRYALAERLEAEYLRALRRVTRQIDHIVKEMAPGGVIGNSVELENMLRAYAKLIEPWARKLATRMLNRISSKDEAAWAKLGKEIGRELRKEMQDAPVGLALQKFLKEQVHLITSLPEDAANRVHKLTMEGMTGAKRADEVAKEIALTGQVTESRAKLIARTEIARTASGLTMVRAQHVGSTHYIWRTSGDSDVRKSHKEMEGAVIPYKTAPILSDGTQCHAGGIYNCRCYPEPIISDV
jgi:SPP1 gp7 family putative phage head morphogenesis protein